MRLITALDWPDPLLARISLPTGHHLVSVEFGLVRHGRPGRHPPRTTSYFPCLGRIRHSQRGPCEERSSAAGAPTRARGRMQRLTGQGARRLNERKDTPPIAPRAGEHSTSQRRTCRTSSSPGARCRRQCRSARRREAASAGDPNEANYRAPREHVRQHNQHSSAMATRAKARGGLSKHVMCANDQITQESRGSST